MNLKERLIQFAEARGITINSMETKCGLSTSTLARCTDGLNTKNLAKVMRAFPELNVRWLLLGEGEPIREISETEVIARMVENQQEMQDEIDTLNKKLEDAKRKVDNADTERQAFLQIISQQANIINELHKK